MNWYLVVVVVICTEVLLRSAALLQLRDDDAVQAAGSGGVRGGSERWPLRGVWLAGARLHRRTAGLLQLLHQQTHHAAHQRRRPQQREQSAAAVHPEPAVPHHYGKPRLLTHISLPTGRSQQLLLFFFRMFCTQSVTRSETCCGSWSSRGTGSRPWWNILLMMLLTLTHTSSGVSIIT